MDYKIGDVVVYTSAGERREVLVDEKESDIKNGQPGFGGIVLNTPSVGMSVWGYDSQIEEVK